MNVRELQLIRTVGELKKYLENLPDNMKLLTLSEYRNKLVFTDEIVAQVEKFKVEKKKDYDSLGFDFIYDEYRVDESGEKYLILGD
jgi:hypothetical protein